METYTGLKKLKEKHGEIEYSAQIPVLALEEHMSRLLEDIRSTFSLPGFRKGQVPLQMVREHVDHAELFRDAADAAIHDAVRDIIDSEHLVIVSTPQITITKLAQGNPAAFTLRAAVFPEIALPDYKKIGKGIVERKDETEVTEEELAAQIEQVRQFIAAHMGGGKAAPPPEISDDFVRTLGNFKNVDEFKADLRKRIGEEKKSRARQAKRDEIIREIIAHAKIAIPEMALEEELAEFAAQRNGELKKAGLTLESYLKESGKTAESLQKEERALIEEHLKARFVLREIERIEGLAADEKDVETAAARLKLRYPDRDREHLHRLAEASITREKLFDLLEGKASVQETPPGADV